MLGFAWPLISIIERKRERERGREREREGRSGKGLFSVLDLDHFI